MRHAITSLVLVLSIPTGAALAAPDDPQVERGKYLVTIMGCNDCHTPMTMGPDGPALDTARWLSGHPEGLVMPPPPALAEPWGWVGAATNTAFAGPWGVSYAANLTPDPETGILAKWTADTFIKTLRTGRHEGRGRPILPPMPWPMYRNATDDDLRAVFAYLRSLKPVKNRVPQPTEPPETGAPATPSAPATARH